MNPLRPKRPSNVGPRVVGAQGFQRGLGKADRPQEQDQEALRELLTIMAFNQNAEISVTDRKEAHLCHIPGVNSHQVLPDDLTPRKTPKSEIIRDFNFSRPTLSELEQ